MLRRFFYNLFKHKGKNERSSDRYIYLAENETYKLYALHESVYLKTKSGKLIPDWYHHDDLFIPAVYGDPTSGIILHGGKHIVISGCGLTIFNTETKEIREIGTNSEDVFRWTNGLHRGWQDDASVEFRFVAYNTENQIRVFKMNVLNLESNQVE